MSILIKGMEMPKHDDEYVIFTVYGDGGVVYGPLNRPHVRYKDRAVPVPPHGRLIDADAFIKQKTEQICENCDRRRGMKDGKLTKRFVYAIGDAPCRACGIGDMLDYVDDAPIVIPAEEGGCTYHEPKPQTNADRIRAMTDEELADYFSELSCWPNASKEVCRGVANCMDCWLDWLKQEVE